tara:strand:- start:673 stop:1605 length:933 start_codon:yes stop_codon:yes gene_type:complete
MKKIIIAGGAGFVGSHLCEFLVEEKNNFIYCIDNLLTGSEKNISHLIEKKNFKFINQDICSKINLEVDQIYNLACPASPIQYQNYPIETINACIDGTRNLLDLARKYNATILQASTSEVYGDPLEHPQNESYHGNVNLNGPRSCYDEGKRVAETIFYNYKTQFNVDIRIARIFNTYGPRMQINDGRVISNFINQSINNSDITIYGDGSQTRSFCYVTDMIAGLVKLMDSDYQNPMNLGNDEEYSILDTANQIVKNMDSSSQIVFKDLPENDPLKRKPNLSLAREIINYNPKILFSIGLADTILYFKSLYE